MNINARVLTKNRMRQVKAEKQLIIRRGSYKRIARAYYRACSDVKVCIVDLPAIFRTVHVAMKGTPEWPDDALDRLVAATVESYRARMSANGICASPHSGD